MSAATATSEVRVGELRVRVLHTQPPVPSPAPPVLILHGWGASIEAVGSITSGLRGSLELVAVDLPGFGESDPPPEPWDATAYATFVLALADTLGIERFSLLGHSHGGRIGIVLAGMAPERLARLVLTGAAGIKPRRKPAYYGRVATAKVGRAVGAVGGPPGKRLQDKMRKKVGSTDWLEASEAMRGTFRLVIGEDQTPRLASIAASTLLLWGRDDEDAPLWMGEKMKQAIPDAGLVVLDGGHFMYAERAGEFNRIAGFFLSEAR